MGRAVREARERPSVLVFLGLSVLLLALIPPGTPSGDSSSMLAVGDSLATGRGFALDCGETGAVPGRSGLCFSTFYPLISVLGVPFIVAGRAVAALTGVSQEFAGHVPAFAVPALCVAVVGAVVTDLAGQLGAGRPRAVAIGVASVASTELLTYSRTYFAEPLVAALTAVAVWGVATNRMDGRRRLGWAFTAVGLVVLAKPQTAALGPALAALSLWRGDRRAALGLLAASLAGVIGMGGYNLLRFGSVADFGGETRDIDAASLSPDAVAESAALLLVSPGRGLLFFAPLAVVGAFAMWRGRRSYVVQAALIAALAVSFLYVTNPGSGYNWGTRYLAPAMPMLVVGSALLRSRAACTLAVVAGIAGFAINVPNLPAYYQRFHQEREERGATPSDAHWSLADGQLLGVWGSAARQLKASRNRSVTDLVEGAGGNEDRVEASALVNIVAIWWWVLPAAGVPLGAGVLLFAVLMAIGVTLLLLAGRGPPRTAVG